MTVLKICGVAVISVFAIVILRIYRSEFVAPVSLVSVIVLLGGCLTIMHPIGEYINDLSKTSFFSYYFDAIMKALGIGIIAETTSTVCRDSGASSIASKVEFGAKLLILSLSLPIVKKIVSMALEVIS